jgi:hypothetical protein
MKLVALLPAALLIGCAVTDDAQTATDLDPVTTCAPELHLDPRFERIELDAKASTDPIPGPQLERFELHIELDALTRNDGTDACACEDDQCVVDWVAANLGCDTCVHLRCDGFDLGACAPCLDTEPACVFD